MPNAANVDSPITIVAYGRSGTSLLARVFEQHRDISLVGETGNFICDLWRSYEFSAGVIAPSYDNSGTWTANADRQGRLVRDAVVSCFPDDKPYWCQKPIGVPVAVSKQFAGDDWDGAAEWYWRCFKTTFPRGRFFTILRHPFDVVRSAMSYWGYDEETVWWSLAFMCHLLVHPASPVEYAVAYDALVGTPEPTVRDLFAYLGVPFDPVVLKAFDTVHVPSVEGRKSGLGRRLDWSSLHPETLDWNYRNAITGLFAKFDLPCGLAVQRPAIVSSSEDSAPCTPAAESLAVCQPGEKPLDGAALAGDKVAEALAAAEHRHRQLVASLSRTIETLHSEYAAKLAESNRQVELVAADTFNRLQNDLQWMKRQLEDSGRYARELEGSIGTLKKSLAARNRGIEWYKKQLASFQSCVAARDEGIAWLQVQCQSWEQSAAKSAADAQALTTQLRQVTATLSAYRTAKEAAIAWWQSQCQSWEESAAKSAADAETLTTQLGQVTAALSAYRTEKEAAIAWLQSQCQSWERSAAASAAIVEKLSMQLQERDAALGRLYGNALLRMLNALSRGALFRTSRE